MNISGNHTNSKNIPWSEFENRMERVFGKKFNRKYSKVDELFFNVERQIKFGEENELSDSEALKYLQTLHSMSGELCVITDYCYEKNCGPFVIKAEDINNFVEKFQAFYGQAFNETDLIIVSFSEKMIWVLFHEGICWLSKGEL